MGSKHLRRKLYGRFVNADLYNVHTFIIGDDSDSEAREENVKRDYSQPVRSND